MLIKWLSLVMSVALRLLPLISYAPLGGNSVTFPRQLPTEIAETVFCIRNGGFLFATVEQELIKILYFAA